jgi:hypothetical protein
MFLTWRAAVHKVRVVGWDGKLVLTSGGEFLNSHCGPKSFRTNADIFLDYVNFIQTTKTKNYLEKNGKQKSIAQIGCEKSCLHIYNFVDSYYDLSWLDSWWPRSCWRDESSNQNLFPPGALETLSIGYPWLLSHYIPSIPGKDGLNLPKYLLKVFHLSAGVLFPSSHNNYNYKLQFFNFRCWWLSSSSPAGVSIT